MLMILAVVPDAVEGLDVSVWEAVVVSGSDVGSVVVFFLIKLRAMVVTSLYRLLDPSGHV
jgi:hypothetical protein